MAGANSTQRLGAYAVATHEGAILLTRISPQGFPAGTWTLPGGGVDHGEDPFDAVRRELYEETSLVASSVTLLDIHSIHIVDVGRDDTYEDYHGVHILYRVEVDPRAPLAVVDVGGSTDLAAWVPISAIGEGEYVTLPMVGHALARI
ncbi:hypothetical protein BH09ACT10_BH09ACT10_21700 [soil metagenome]